MTWTNGADSPAASRWISRASTSFPAPVSPRNRMGLRGVVAMRSSIVITDRIASERGGTRWWRPASSISARASRSRMWSVSRQRCTRRSRSDSSTGLMT